MRRPVFAANWKMHHGPSDTRAFLRSFLAHYARRPDRQVLFFPPAVSLTTVVDGLRERQDIQVGAQNIHWQDKGAFTGELSAPMARDAGATMALVGHSERRHVFGETDEQTALKVAAAVRAGLVPMLCVGETLEERERGETQLVVLRQLRTGISAIEPAAIATMMIAYEPVWAIGTGKTATPDDASLIHQVIRQELLAILGEKARAIPICYGGSVNRGNAATLLEAPEVDGLLVGGASLDAEGWSSIVRS
ncbi:MAG: triose-phosphate isomerase [Gemmatimonadaceae bacterium]|nr:triose-phosphate isomerase [Gemmatimonadaceae bacterium]